MELWIRSQDKNALRKINTSLYLKDGLSNYAKGEVIFIVSGGDELGEYESKERALEVLDEIQKILKPKMFLKKGIISGSFDNQIFKNSDKVEIQELSTYVYEMPKD